MRASSLPRAMLHPLIDTGITIVCEPHHMTLTHCEAFRPRQCWVTASNVEITQRLPGCSDAIRSDSVSADNADAKPQRS
jgi:hypothetical protein